MTPAAIISEALVDGVSLALSPTGNIRATGEQFAVNRWLPIIRDHKPGIVAVLSADERIERMVAKLDDNPGLRYAIEPHTEADPEVVILTVAIRGKGACELRIPKSNYDAFALLELVEKHTKPEKLH